MNKKIFVYLALCLMLATAAFGATSLTTPADSATLTLGATYNFTGSSDVTVPISCEFLYMHKGGSSNTSLGNATGNNTWLSTTVPDSFGTNQFHVRCGNSTLSEADSGTMSVSIRNYDAAEISEVTIDMIVAVGAAIVGFASLIAIILLFVFLKKRLPRV